MKHAALFAVTALLALSCAKASTTAPASAPALTRAEPTETLEGKTSALFHEGAPGTILIFVRNVIDEKVQDIAGGVADGLVERCDPAFDTTAIVEPGIASLMPGLYDIADKELSRRRRSRASCLKARGEDAETATLDAKDQVSLTLDGRNIVRHDVLGAADPGGDVVVAAYGPRGESVYRAPVPTVADSSAIITRAVDAIRAARTVSPDPPD